MKTLTEQYRLIKEDKGHKGVFLKEAKKQFPNLIRNAATFKEASTILKQKGIISENYVDLQPINNPIERKKESYETAFANFLAEAEAKAEEKKVSKEVEEDAEKNYDYKDKKDPNNMIFGQIQMGYYCEYKDPKNEGKTDQELLEIVYKNLAKDPIYYTKNGQFGEQDLGYTDDAPSLGPTEEPKGEYKSSGYGKLKENKHRRRKPLKEGHYTEFVDDGENKYIDFNYDAIESVMGKYGKTPDDLEDWLNTRDVEITPTDKEVIKWLNNSISENKPLNEHSISMAGGIVTGGGFSHMNYMDYFGLNEDEKTRENTKDTKELTAAMKELGDTAEETKKKISNLEEEEEYSEKEIRRMYGLDRGAPPPKEPHFKNIFKDDTITIPDLKEGEAPMHIEKLADAAEAAYDAGMDIDEILSMIEQHLGLKMGDF